MKTISISTDKSRIVNEVKTTVAYLAAKSDGDSAAQAAIFERAALIEEDQDQLMTYYTEALTCVADAMAHKLEYESESEDGSAHTFVVQVPDTYPDALLQTTKNVLHNYMVAYICYKWLSLVHSADAEASQTQAQAMLSGLQSLARTKKIPSIGLQDDPQEDEEAVPSDVEETAVVDTEQA